MNEPHSDHRSEDAILVEVIEEITERLERGETPAVEEYLARYPAIAAELRDAFDALQLVRGLRSPAETDGADPLVSRRRALGDFQLLREIGRGGMGVVYEAEQASLGRRVAVKVLPFAAMLDPRRLQRFQNEARAAALLRHPNIVGIHSVGCERGVHYYAMEYVEGRTLAQVIEELRASSPLPRVGEGSGVRAGGDGSVVGRGFPEPAQTPTEGFPAPSPRPASPDAAEVSGGRWSHSDDGNAPYSILSTPHSPEPSLDTDRQPQAAVSTKRPHQSTEFFRSVARLGIQAAEALDHAHQSGVVHRDIKPSNLMVDAQGHLWITDFGLAMTQKDPGMTATGDVLGTLRYMSPEQAQGDRRRMDHRTDIYSLGVTLYELVTLQPAFPGDNRETVLRQLSEEDPPPPRRLNPSIPRDLETIILKAMAKEPSRRYATAQELADDLKRFLAHEPIRARRPTLADRAAKWSRRHRPMVWSVAAVAAIASVLLAGVMWIAYRRAVQVERDAGEYLAAAAAFLQSGDYAAADRELAEARGRLDAGRYGDGPLADEAARLSGELSAKDQFQKLRHRVHSEMYAVDRNILDQAQAHCRAAMELAGVFAAAPPQEPPVFQDLDAGSQAGFDEGVVEMLSVWAWLEIGRSEGKPPAEREACHRRAIEAFSKINDIHRPIPAIYLWIADSQEVLGQKTAAEQSRARAGALRPATAMDYFLLGEYHARHGRPDMAVTAYWQALAQQPDHYVSLLAAGVALDELKRHESAEAMLTGAIAMNPQTTLAYVKRANSRWALGRFPQVLLAEGDIQKARELDPDLARALAQRGQDLVFGEGKFPTGTFVLGFNYNANVDLAGAIGHLDDAIRLDPGCARSYYTRAEIQMLQRQFDKAIADYSEALRLKHPADVCYYGRGLAYSQKGDSDKAIADHTEAIRIDAKWAGPYVGRGIAHKRNGEYEKALADLNEAIRINPRSPYAYINRGLVYAEKGDFDGAIADCTEAIRAAPGDFVPYLFRARVNRKKGDLVRAIADCAEAIRINPTISDIYHERARVNSKKGDLVRAIADYTEAIRINPTDSDIYAARAQTYVDRANWDKAMADCDESLRLDPRRANSYSLRGYVWLKKDNFDRAIADCSEAIRLDPRCFQAYVHRAAAFHEKDQYDKAISDNSEAIRMNPKECSVEPDAGDLATVYANRGLNYIDKGDGDWEKALADIDRALQLDKNNETAQGAAARHMVFSPDRRGWPSARAVEVGEKAVAIAPKDPESWNALGVAQYRAGNHQAAIEAMAKARELRGGTTSIECMFVAMAFWKLGKKEEARGTYDAAAGFMDKEISDRAAWASKTRMFREASLRVRAEAAELLAIEKKPPAAKEKTEKAK